MFLISADNLADRAFARAADAASAMAAAGKEMLAAGRFGKAVRLLDSARVLLSVVEDFELRADILEALIGAYVDAGQARLAEDLSAEVDRLECSGLRPESLAALRIQLAWADILACEAGRGLARVRDTRALLSGQGSDHLSLALDAVECWLLAQSSREPAAGQLARKVIEAASEHAEPQAACHAWELLGAVTRRTDPAESTASFRRARLLALRHGLHSHRLRAQLELGVDEWTRTGDTSRLTLLYRETEHSHSLPVSCLAGTLIAIDLTFRGLYPQAHSLVERHLAQAREAGLITALRWALLARAVLAGHQSRRRDLETALNDLAGQGPHGPYLLPLALMLGAAVCALLEADWQRAAHELRRAAALDAGRPGPFPVTGWAGCHRPEDLPFWSRPFALLSRGAMLGRQGRRAEALAAVTLAGRMAAPYPLTHHLGLPMIAELAHDDGWGAPAAWLRQAEAFFHDFPAPALSNACRSLLQRMGAPAPQHRQDADRIPGCLRALGVTVREYEVLKAIAGGKGNKDVAEVLCISPRTVEKHVASLLAKTGLANRKALAELAGLDHDASACPSSARQAACWLSSSS